MCVKELWYQGRVVKVLSGPRALAKICCASTEDSVSRLRATHPPTQIITLTTSQAICVCSCLCYIVGAKLVQNTYDVGPCLPCGDIFFHTIEACQDYILGNMLPCLVMYYVEMMLCVCMFLFLFSCGGRPLVEC